MWVDPKADGSPPNNWVGCFGGPAWTLDETTGQYYLHNFLPEQPDLNWWSEEVRTAFDDILRFWWDRGIAGFRIDVCNMIIKDAELRDNPPATEDDPFLMQMFGQRPEYTSNRPEVHGILKHWRQMANGYEPARVLLGETNVEALETLAAFYGDGQDELSLSFNFPFIESAFEAPALREVVERTEALLLRAPGRSGRDRTTTSRAWPPAGPVDTRARFVPPSSCSCPCGARPVLYQGDEIGLTDGVLTHDQILDPVGLRFWPAYVGRDPERTPMPWTGGPHGGFTEPGSIPWLPMNDPSARQCGRPAALTGDRSWPW